jgi:hypothetical protein
LGVLVHLGLRGDLAITKVLQDLQDFTPGRKLAAAAALVEIHRLHELDLLVRVVTFAGRRVNLAAAFDLASIARAVFGTGVCRGGASMCRGGPEAFGGVPSVVSPAIDRKYTGCGCGPDHKAFTLSLEKPPQLFTQELSLERSDG